MRSSQYCIGIVCLIVLTCTASLSAAEKLKVHGIFRSNMVIQRDKPIKIWGWAPTGSDVKVSFGALIANGKAAGDAGLWAVTFDPQPANATAQTLRVEAGTEAVEMTNILIGDIWVMNGQSNMAFALRAVYMGEFEASMAHLPQLRVFRIGAGAESEYEEVDIKDKFVNGPDDSDKNWKVCTPEVALDMGAIGFAFGSRVQRSLQIPIGIIDNARGGASLESLVPRRKFGDHPLTAEYLKWVDAKRAEFSEEAFLKAELEKWTAANEKWEKQVAADKAKGVT